MVVRTVYLSRGNSAQLIVDNGGPRGQIRLRHISGQSKLCEPNRSAVERPFFLLLSGWRIF